MSGLDGLTKVSPALSLRTNSHLEVVFQVARLAAFMVYGQSRISVVLVENRGRISLNHPIL